jgi:hypothetical protein
MYKMKIFFQFLGILVFTFQLSLCDNSLMFKRVIDLSDPSETYHSYFASM